MKEKILIASDSTTDLSPELIEKYGIKILPLTVNMGGKEYCDGVDINPDMIYENYARTGELPKTAAVNLTKFEEFFEEYTKQGYTIILFTISAQMSSTYHNASLAAADYPNVHIVDTKNLSTGGGLMVISAACMAEEGKTTKEIVEYCEDISGRIDASFIIDSLEFLHKGGRCSVLAALGANLLKLKPCILVRGGKMTVGKKYRGSFENVLKSYVADQLGDCSDVELDHIFITHAGCPDEINNAVIAAVKEAAPFKNVYFTRAGCTISSHCGRDCLGVLFIRKNNIKID